MKRTVFFVIVFLTATLAFGASYRKTFATSEDWDATLYDWRIDATSVPGEIRLLKTELITDETGVTTGRMHEMLKGDIRILKEFQLDRIEAESAVLLIHWNRYDLKDFKEKGAFLWVEVNGRPLRLDIDHDRMLTGGWIRCDVPVEWLRPGLNSFVLRNTTEYDFYFSLEASRYPNRSARSLDGGRTWDRDRLGTEGFIDGEYLIRLRLGRYPEKGEILSDFIDAASLIAATAVKPAIRLRRLALRLDATTPAGTSIVPAVRGGRTPSYDPATWGAWTDPARVSSETLSEWRYVQWKAELRTSHHGRTPVLRSLSLSADIDLVHQPGKLAADDRENRRIVRGYYPYTFQDAGESRLEVLRERFRLNEVVGGCSTEFQEYRTLAFWLKGIWRDGWSPQGEAALHTPWDALISLELVPQYKASGMCTIYANTFVQTCLAVGLQARGIILDHHFTAEVWSNDHEKWVVIDVGNTSNSLRAAFQKHEGRPLDSLEIHELARASRTEEIWIVPVGTHDRFPGAEDVEQGVLGPRQWKSRFGMPMRNNFLTSWMPGELEHGFIQYHYDGYLWWKDSALPAYEEYTFHSSHARDFAWTLNQAEIHLTATDRPNLLDVHLDTVTPNFKTFEVRINGGEWTPSAASFTWSLAPGDNILEARPVSRFGREGIVSRIALAFQGEAK